MEAALRNENQYTGNVRVFQTLPRHMRRRAASYNIKRVPKSLRQRAIEEMARTEEVANNVQKDKKKGARRIRRSRGIIQELFGKRSKEGKTWLPTHLWHAKRMHMTQLWGYMIPEFPNDRGTRATYRASLHQCVINDVSYTACLELVGTREDISNVVRYVFDPTFAPCERISDGVRQASTFLHRPKSFPSGSIAPCRYFWRPPSPSDTNPDSPRCMWIWIHPSAAKEAEEVINEAISMSGLSVKLTPLINEFARFELTGPRSHAILHEVLGASETVIKKVMEEEKEEKKSMGMENDSDMNNRAEASAACVWRSLRDLRTPASLPAGVMIALEVYDPRLSFPPKMSPRSHDIPSIHHATTTDPSLYELLKSWAPHVSDSALFCAERRHLLKTSSRVSDKSINKLREASLVPGTLPSAAAMSKIPTIPVLLVQRGGGGGGCTTHRPDTDNIMAGPASAELSGGWDVLLPATHAPEFWKSLVFAGARAIGLDDRRRLYREAGVASFPEDYPETRAWGVWAQGIANLEQTKWDRKPKGKRVNYEGRNVHSPFLSRFDELVKDRQSSSSSSSSSITTEASVVVSETVVTTSNDSNSNIREKDTAGPRPVMVLHSPKLVRELGKHIMESEMTLEVLTSRLQSMIEKCSTSSSSSLATDTVMVPTLPQDLSSAFVRVRLAMLDGGAPCDRAVVYSVTSDHFSILIKSLETRTAQHHQLQGSSVLDDKAWEQFVTTSAVAVGQGGKGDEGGMTAETGLLDIVPDVRHVVGYVTSGGFSLACGRGAALASCTVAGLFRGVSEAMREERTWKNVIVGGSRLKDSSVQRLVFVKDAHARRLRPAIWSLLV